MTDSLRQIELLSEVDSFLTAVQRWRDLQLPWPPLERCRSFLSRVMKRVEAVRVRLDSPLVVATFGGTGTGKSALVNALVGRECTQSGRQRPTTTKPILVAHPRCSLEPLLLPLNDCEVVRVDSPLLSELVIVDCPDPDTSDEATSGSNLQVLRSWLPHVDVLIYVSTQQKYRSARVLDELAQAAPGCKVVFVQTFADLDSDIREDWRKQLTPRFSGAEIFFVDTQKALSEQAGNHPPSGEFGKLLEWLGRELAATQRIIVRRSNLIDLVSTALDHCRDQLQEHLPTLVKVESELNAQRLKTIEHLAVELGKELDASRGLWERRLLSAVTDRWESSPFSFVLRIYNSLGSLIASSALFRVRSSAQMALVGAVQGMRWLRNRSQERQAADKLDRVGSLNIDDNWLHETQLVIQGYVQEAGLDGGLVADLPSLRAAAEDVEEQFLGDAARRVEQIIDKLATRNSKLPTRLFFETLFLSFVGYLLWRIGKNFFYDSAINNEEILDVNFYVPAAIFLGLWTGSLVIWFTVRLRGGLSGEIRQLAQNMAKARLAGGLFPELDQFCHSIHQQVASLESLRKEARSLSQK